MISGSMVCLAQTVHLSCTDTNTVSKWTKMRFHMTHVTSEFYRVRSKWFPSLWYVQRNHAPIAHQDRHYLQNGPNQASTWASSPRSTIRCVQNNTWAYGMFSANSAPILHLYWQCLQTDWNEIAHDPHHLGVPSGASKMTSELMIRSAQTMHLSCVRISNISKRTESSFHLSPVT
jgi:hypothetical protein